MKPLTAALAGLLATALAVSTAVAGNGETQARPALPAPPEAVSAVPVYLAVEAATGQVLAARQPSLSFVPASLTKVMTAYVAFEEMAAGRLNPAKSIALSTTSHARWQGKGTRLDLKPGEGVPVDTLLAAITTVSANDACVALAEGHAGSIAAWTNLMNRQAAMVGMRESHFASPNGWPDNGATYVSARDLVALGRAMVNRHPDLYRRYFGRKSLTFDGVTRTNHDPTVGVIPGADGIKTGFTGEAGYGFLGSAVRDGRRVMIVVAGARSEAERAAASRALMEWAYSAWAPYTLFRRGQNVSLARVQGGTARTVPLVAPRDIAVALPRVDSADGKRPDESAASISLRIRYAGPLPAPVRAGAEVARLEIRLGENVVASAPLVTAHAVSGAGPFDRLGNGLAGLLP